ncbi:MAG: leucyl aminopeptidase family protein [Acetobacteraceae bacterium]|nr:leucyl aminopeptidase family protein [Acetobacteraceae bacterium]
MSVQDLDCLAGPGESARPLRVLRPGACEAFLSSLPSSQAQYLRQVGFTGAAQQFALIPGPEGVAGAVVGLGEDRGPYAFGGLAAQLPKDSIWKLERGDYDAATALLGFCLGAYQYRGAGKQGQRLARLQPPAGCDWALTEAATIWSVRDLINTPANLLGPAELAEAVIRCARTNDARVEQVNGTELERSYPAIAAVGAGSERAPHVVTLRWTGSRAGVNAPLISLCGKGVCFDTGGYDIKPSSAMLRMKKDMGGAACILGIAHLVMQADLPVRLAVRIGCVENSISGRAMRPQDVIRTRCGLSVEIGDTDAEGRLVLCDLLSEAVEENPALLLDCATLTGAARVALGPELPAFFCNHEGWAQVLSQAGQRTYDPLWRLPLWEGYDSWLNSPVADMNNVSSKPYAGAIIAALFLRRFVPLSVAWAHIDLFAWNEATQPGRPEGGEAQAVRAVFAALRFAAENAFVIAPIPDQNSEVT